MTPSLPDDLRDWPDDPAELFGVDENVDRKTLRRVYSQLVRQYKPEHFPEHFQRIRDGYEMLLHSVEWRERFQAAENESNDEYVEPDFVEDGESEDSTQAASPIEFSSMSTFDVSASRPTKPRDDEVEDAWQTAIDGDLAAAYRKLAEIEQRRPGHEEVSIRLHWLLRVKASLDPKREPVDWLIKSLKRSGLSDWAFGLYQDAVRESPELARRDAARSLFQTPAPVWQLGELARCHWAAYAQLEDWDSIWKSLETLRPAIENEDSETWARLMFTALDFLWWTDDGEASQAVQAISDELREYEHLRLTLSYDFDRFETLQMLPLDARELGSYSQLPDDLHRILKKGWYGFDAQLRHDILDMIEPWVANPAKTLADLDRLAERSPAALERLGEMFQGLSYDSGWWDDEEGVEEVLKRGLLSSLREGDWQTYSRARPAMCIFCLNEGILLDRIESLILGDRYSFMMLGDEFVHELSEDAALDCLLKANLAFRS